MSAWETLPPVPPVTAVHPAWLAFSDMLEDIREERLDWIDPATWKRHRSDLLLAWQRMARQRPWAPAAPPASLSSAMLGLLTDPATIPSGAEASDPVVPICYALGIRRIDYHDRDGVHLARAIYRRLPDGAGIPAFVTAFWDWHEQAEDDERDIAAPLAQTVLVWEHRRASA